MAGKAQYKTRQYSLVLQYLESLRGAQTTVPAMAEHFKSAGTPIGTATLYRQMEKLAAQGQVRKYVLDGVAGTCYQYLPDHAGCDAHFHLKCEQCGRLIHLDCDETQSFQHHVQESHGFRANYSKTVIYGVCKACLAGREQSHR